MKSAINWIGGKQNMMKHLIHLIPEHLNYCEPFGGSAAFLFAKPKSKLETYNDLNSGLVNFFKVLRDREKCRKLKRMLYLTPYSREVYNDYKKTWREQDDDLERAYRFYYVALSSFGGFFGGSWGYGKNIGAIKTKQFKNTVKQLEIFCERIQEVQIENQDYLKILNVYDNEDTFTYLDPPYENCVSKGKCYEHDSSETLHKDLVDYLLEKGKGKFLLSGYPNEEYKRLEEAGWNTLEFKKFCNATCKTVKNKGLIGAGTAQEKNFRTEKVWFNYPIPEKQPKETIQKQELF